MNRMKKFSALFLSSLMVLSLYSNTYAAEVVKSSATADLSQSSGEERESLTNVTADPDASPDTSETVSGYTKADAEAAAEDLYGFLDDEAQKNMYVQSIVNSVFYDPANCLKEEDGSHALVLYRGNTDEFSAIYHFAKEGLTFFSNPVMVFGEQNGKLLLAVETGSVFNTDKAADNMRILQKMQNVMHTVRDTVSQQDNTSKAEYISNYIADALTYDLSYGKNCLADAVDSGVCACVGYNAEALLLFGNCGIPYRSIVAKSRKDGRGHIFGVALISKAWLLFDLTNYDQDYGKEPYWIFSDTYREKQFYADLGLLRKLPE